MSEARERGEVVKKRKCEVCDFRRKRERGEVVRRGLSV